MEYVCDRIHQEASGSCGTMSSSSRRTSASSTSFESSTTPPSTPLLKAEWFDWAEDVEEELERKVQKKLALSRESDCDEEQTSDKEQNPNKELIDNVQNSEEQMDEEQTYEERITETQVWRTLGESLKIGDPCQYYLPACAWNLYHLTCSLSEYEEYAQEQLISAQYSPVPFLVLTDDTGAHYLLEEVVKILSEEEIYWIRQHRDPYQENLENYLISCAPSHEQQGSEINSNGQSELEQGLDGPDKSYLHEHTHDKLGDVEIHQIYDISYGKSDRPNSYLMSYGYCDSDNLRYLSRKDRIIDEHDGEFERIRDGLKDATDRQLKSEELAQSSKKLEEAKDTIEKLTSYADRLKAEVKILNAECQVANNMKQRVETDLKELKNQQAKQSTEELEEANEAIAELEQYVISLRSEVRRSQAVCQIAIAEKESVKAALQALQDEIGNQSVNTEGLPIHIKKETYGLQEELASLRKLYAKLEKQHMFAVQEVKVLRKKLEIYEAIDNEGQQKEDKEYLLPIRQAALGWEEVAIDGDYMAKRILFSEAIVSQHDENLSNDIEDDSIEVINELTDAATIDDAIEEEEVVTKSDTEQSTVDPDDSGDLRSVSTCDDGICETKTVGRSWAFDGKSFITFAGPGTLGFSPFHSAFNNGASSILGLQNGCHDRIANAKTDTETVEPTDSKQQDAAKAHSTGFTGDCYSFTFLKGRLEVADELSHQDAGENVDCEEGGEPQHDQTSSLPMSPILCASTSSVQAPNSDVEGTAGEDTVGDEVRGFTVYHKRFGDPDIAGKNLRSGGTPSGGEACTNMIGGGGTGGGNNLGCPASVINAVNGLDNTTKGQISDSKSDAGESSSVNGPGGTSSYDMSPWKPEIPKKWWKRLWTFLAETALVMSDQLGAVG